MAERPLGSFDSLKLCGFRGQPLISNFAFLTMHRLYVLFRPDHLRTWFGLKKYTFLICERINMAILKENKLDLMFMKHYAPNRCLNIKVAKLRTGVGSTETSNLQNCSVKLFKEHFKVQICKGRLFEKIKITFFLIFTN